MARTWLLLCIFLPLAVTSAGRALAEDRPWPAFETQEIDRSLTVGYAVLLHDINEDHRPDIVVVDSRRVIWFENPNWRLHTIIAEGSTAPDNVCIAPLDVNGDGHDDLVLGAGWRGFNTKDPGTLQWLEHPGRPAAPWHVHPIGEVISLHRIRVGDIDGDRAPELVVAPLLGPGTSRARNFMERPVPLFYYEVPSVPGQPWQRTTIDARSLHVMHNIWLDDLNGNGRLEVLTASYEGVRSYELAGDRWRFVQIGEGDQSNPERERGASEVKTGRLADGRNLVATIEPWHGDKAVAYVQEKRGSERYRRVLLDNRLRQGHAVWCADLDGDGSDEVVVGSRQHFSESEKFGLRIYRAVNADATRWERMLLDHGGMACEDLAVEDLDGDGRLDIVAVGRGTHNVRIYWNRGTKTSR